MFFVEEDLVSHPHVDGKLCKNSSWLKDVIYFRQAAHIRYPEGYLHMFLHMSNNEYSFSV